MLALWPNLLIGAGLVAVVVVFVILKKGGG